MLINTDNMVSITEANQNFSQVAKKVDKYNEVIILKNNKPLYVLRQFSENEMGDDDKLELIARRILSEHQDAFKELAK